MEAISALLNPSSAANRIIRASRRLDVVSADLIAVSGAGRGGGTGRLIDLRVVAGFLQSYRSALHLKKRRTDA